MYLPRPLYETLPVLYVACGIATISTLDAPVAMLSGATLGFAGILIYSLRRKFRLRRSAARN